jgi:hypothetical protein
MSTLKRENLNGVPVLINNDEKRGVVTVITDQKNVDEISHAASSLGIPGDIAARRFGDGNYIEPPKTHSMSTLGDRYTQIFGHSDFKGDKK